VVQPSLAALKDRLDPDVYGGAPLLGVNGVCMIGHGSSNARAVANGVAATARAIRGDLTGQIATSIAPASPAGR
jgi:glycerol-3-phosphate acyltransferase PlsX